MMVGTLMYIFKDVERLYKIIGSIVLIIIFVIIDKLSEKKYGYDVYTKTERIIEGAFFAFWLFSIFLIKDIIEENPLTWKDILFEIIGSAIIGFLYGFAFIQKDEKPKK